MASVPGSSDPVEGGHSVGTARRIDQLGRIVVPAELRKMMGISSGDLLDFRMIDGHISLFKVEPECALCNGTTDLSAVHGRHLCARCLEEIRQMPKCAICSATEDLVERNGKFVCENCMREISLV